MNHAKPVLKGGRELMSRLIGQRVVTDDKEVATWK